MKKYRILPLLLALTMLLVLCACGKDTKSDDPNHFELGDYTLDYKGSCIMYDEYGRDALVMTFDFTNNSKENASCGWVISTKYMQSGVEMESAYVITDINTYASVAEKYYSDVAPGVTLEVKNAHLLNDMSEVTVDISELWSGKSYTLTVDPSTLERIENDVSYNDSWDLDWVYDSDETSEEETATENAEETADKTVQTTSFTDWWEGDWYGWWIVNEGTGAYEGYAGYWWDAFARISVNDDLTGNFEIWDNEGSYDDLVGQINVSFTADGATEHGTMISESGEFMGGEREPGELVIDPNDAPKDEMIAFQGVNGDDNGEYTFIVYLRPWGTIWDDVEEAELPYYYRDWYLPYVEAGAPMPDKFDENVIPEAGSTTASAGNMIPEQSGMKTPTIDERFMATWTADDTMQTAQQFSNEAGTSIDVLREEMSNSTAGYLFGVGYIGYYEYIEETGIDFGQWYEAAVSPFAVYYPFFLEIDSNHIIGESGYLYCIIAKDYESSITVKDKSGQTLYSASNGDPILLFCDQGGDGYTADLTVTISAPDGTVFTYAPTIDEDIWGVPATLVGDERRGLSWIILPAKESSLSLDSLLAEGWLGIGEYGIAGDDVLDPPSWTIYMWDEEKQTTVNFSLSFCPNPPTNAAADGEVLMQCFYEDVSGVQAEWEGWWILETELDQPSLLQLDLMLMRGDDKAHYEDVPTLSETYWAMIHPNGEILLLIPQSGYSALPFMGTGVPGVELMLAMG